MLVGCITVSTVVNSLRWRIFKTVSILLTGNSDKVPFQVMKYKNVAIVTAVHLLGRLRLQIEEDEEEGQLVSCEL